MYDNFVFARPVTVFVEANGIPIIKMLHNMQDYIDLHEDARTGVIELKFGDITVDQQLWLELAKFVMFLKAKD